MHARLVRVTGSPEGAGERAAVFEREALPVIREQPGFVGVVVLADPATGAGAVVTYWDGEEAMKASAVAMAALRDRVTAGQGLEVLGMEEYEVTLMERRGTPSPGNAVRLSRARGSAEAAGDALAQLREGLALCETLPGFKAFIAGVDRSSGRYCVVTGWEDAAARDAAEEATAEQRARLAERIGTSGLEVDRYEVVLASIPTGAATS